MASLAVEKPFIAPKNSIPLKERLIVALDVPTVEQASALVERLGDAVEFYKIGMQLQFGGGISYADDLIRKGKKVFLDSKLFDIDETIERAVENVARMGVNFLTVHGNGKTISAAVRGRGTTDLKVFSVTVLTSLDKADLTDIFGKEDADVQEFVRHRAERAFIAGADGVIASGQEAGLIRELIGGLKILDQSKEDRSFNIVTPGIRMAGDAPGDPKRITTPYDAIKGGADYLVVGRPITQKDDPRQAAECILEEIEKALAD
jgi:orotidine-5'-phosphate decarboxylase